MDVEAGYEKIAQAAAELDRQQQRLRSVHAGLAKAATKFTAKDNMLTVELDARGELAAIRFNTQKFRQMAPAELGSAVVEAISSARAQHRERVLSAYRPMLSERPGLARLGLGGNDPDNDGLDRLLAGELDLDRMFDAARQHAAEMMAAAGRAGGAEPHQGRPVPKAGQTVDNRRRRGPAGPGTAQKRRQT